MKKRIMVRTFISWEAIRSAGPSNMERHQHRLAISEAAAKVNGLVDWSSVLTEETQTTRGVTYTSSVMVYTCSVVVEVEDE